MSSINKLQDGELGNIRSMEKDSGRVEKTIGGDAYPIMLKGIMNCGYYCLR